MTNLLEKNKELICTFPPNHKIFEPIRVIQNIAQEYESRIIDNIDSRDYIYVSVENILIYRNDSKLLIDNTGFGLTYNDACINLLNLYLNRNYILRTKDDKYATRRIREIILYSNLQLMIGEYYV